MDLTFEEDVRVAKRNLESQLGRSFDDCFRRENEYKKIKLNSKISTEYSHVQNIPPPRKAKSVLHKKSIEDVLNNSKHDSTVKQSSKNNQLVLVDKKDSRFDKSLTLAQPQEPEWHPQWKLMKVISGGHLGWVRSISVDPTNQWFATGSADRTIKIWDLAASDLKLTLTGHISTVRGLAISKVHTYLYSCGEDKKVLCWDLETNKSIRHYHGHLSAVYSISIHPTIENILITGGRDATARVWDIRSREAIHVLTGHKNSIFDIKTQGSEPQVITASADSTIRLWDLAAGRCRSVLTNHKKGVRSLAIHPTEHTMASASADNIKKWKFPDGNFMENFSGHKAIINSLSLNQDNVLVSCADNGTMSFWDWKSCYMFQETKSIPQPGSLEAEAGILASTFDISGSRLITCEADKTIKIWKEDDTSTPESHPILWKPDRNKKSW